MHTEKNRGRAEERTVKVYDNLKGIDPEWVGLKTLVAIKRKIKIKDKRTIETAYFISSLLTYLEKIITQIWLKPSDWSVMHKTDVENDFSVIQPCPSRGDIITSC